MLDQGKNLYLISLSILTTCMVDNVGMLLGEIICLSLLGVKWLSHTRYVMCKGVNVECYCCVPDVITSCCPR